MARAIGSDTLDGGSDGIPDQDDGDDTLTTGALEDEFRISIGASPAGDLLSADGDDPDIGDSGVPDIGDGVMVTVAAPAPPMVDALFPADHWSVDLTGASDSFLQ